MLNKIRLSVLCILVLCILPIAFAQNNFETAEVSYEFIKYDNIYIDYSLKQSLVNQLSESSSDYYVLW